jgi:hypothetical protein
MFEVKTKNSKPKVQVRTGMKGIEGIETVQSPRSKAQRKNAFRNLESLSRRSWSIDVSEGGWNLESIYSPSPSSLLKYALALSGAIELLILSFKLRV